LIGAAIEIFLICGPKNRIAEWAAVHCPDRETLKSSLALAC
jgi:hypothetical protein